MEEAIVLVQVILPPGLVTGEEEEEGTARALMTAIGAHMGVEARVIFFTQGSEVYRLEGGENCERG